MMVSLKEMKECATRIDEGINNLELKLVDVYKLSQVSQRSSSNARDVIVQIQNDLMEKLNAVEEVVEVGSNNVEENYLTIETAEGILEEIDSELQDMDKYIINFGIEPFSKIFSNENSSDIESERSETQSSGVTGSNRKLLFDESPVFASPNYSSTPESNSCTTTSKNHMRSASGSTPFFSSQVNTKSFRNTGLEGSTSNSYTLNDSSARFHGIQSTGKKSNRSGIRNYTPPPLLPLSARASRSVRYWP